MVEWSHVWTFGSPVATEGSLGVGINWYVNPIVTVLVGGLFDLFGANQPENVQLIFSLAFALEPPRAPTAMQ